MFVKINEFVTRSTDFPTEVRYQLFQTLIIFLAAWILQKVLNFIFFRNIKNPKVRYHWNKTVSYLVYTCALIIITNIWFAGIYDIAMFLGLISAGLAVAMKDPLVNLAGWIFILWRKPFEVGDRVQIGGHKGDVIDQRLFMFSVLEVGNWVQEEQSTGRIINIPNGLIFTEALANYNKGFQFIWNELHIRLTFESNWEKAQLILDEIANNNCLQLTKQAEDNLRIASSKMMIFYSALTPRVYVSVEDYGILLTVRYLCKIKERRRSAEAIWKDTLRAFAKQNDIDFAYPTQRFYMNLSEGKPGTKPKRQNIETIEPDSNFNK